MLAKFIGRQIARIKIARDYVLIVLNVVTMLSMLTMAFLQEFSLQTRLFLFSSMLVISFLILLVVGYFADKKGISQSDYRKNAEFQREAVRMLWHEVIIPEIRTLLEDIKK